jgi:hypothetical protein
MEKLSFKHIEEIKKHLTAGTFSEESEIRKITQLGYDEPTALKLLVGVIKEYKQELYLQIKEDKELEEKGNIASTVAVVTSLMVSILGQNSGALILLSLVVACVAGFIGYPKKPIAGVLGLLTGALLMPFIVGIYLGGRSSFFTLEMIIPMALSYGPAMLVKYLISKFFYEDSND